MNNQEFDLEQQGPGALPALYKGLSNTREIYYLVRKIYTLVKDYYPLFIMHLIFLDHRFKKAETYISLFLMYKKALQHGNSQIHTLMRNESGILTVVTLSSITDESL